MKGTCSAGSGMAELEGADPPACCDGHHLRLTLLCKGTCCLTPNSRRRCWNQYRRRLLGRVSGGGDRALFRDPGTVMQHCTWITMAVLRAM